MTMLLSFEQQGYLRSSRMQEAVRGLELAIAASGGVLICGEPGTGREMFARAIHRLSHDGHDGPVERLLLPDIAPQAESSRRPFVAVDCTHMPDVEGRVFGCIAPRERRNSDGLEHLTPQGALHQALEGTLFLRQIPEMPLRLQLRFIRLLQDGEAWVDDGRAPTIVAIRIRVMGTMGPANGGDSQGIHPELLKRLSATTIHIPPLRERREDLPALVRDLLIGICGSLNIPVKNASNEAMELISALQWRGNFNELRALLRTLATRTTGRQIRLRDVLAHVRLDGRAETLAYGGTLKEAREQFEREYVGLVLEQHHGRVGDAARALGIQRTNLYRKIRQLSVQRRTRRASLS